MRYLLLASCLAIASSAAPPGAGSRFESLIAEAKARVREIGPSVLAKKLAAKDAFTLIDVREDAEWAGGRIPGAVHISRGVLERDIERTVPDPDAEIVVYCQGGGRSALAADSLQRMGYGRVYSLQGGFKAWLDAGNPKL